MSFQQRNDTLLVATDATTDQTATTIDCTVLDKASLQVTYTDTTPSAVIFASADIDTGTDTLTAVDHGLFTGLVGQFTTSDTLPTGISALTDYFVIVVDADTIKIASSLANALAGTAVNITNAGVGDQTFTPTALSGVLKVQMSDDAAAPSNWTDVPGSTVTISSSGSIYWSSETTYTNSSKTYRQLDLTAKWLRLLYTATSGSVTILATCNASSLTRN